jgi:hypothetical protein
MKKVTFLRDVSVDYFDRRLNETYPKSFRRHDVVRADAIEFDGKYCNVALENGDTLMNVLRSSVEIA